MHTGRNILFLKAGVFSNINENVEAQLRKNFPGFRLVTLDVLSLMQKKKKVRLINFFFFLLEYGWDFLTLSKKRHTWKDWFFVTAYFHKKISTAIAEFVRQSGYSFAFSIQTTSLFNGAMRDIPHFVYTDSTVLANLYYPNINMASVMKSRAWMRLEPKIYHDCVMNFTFSTNQSKSLIEQYHVPPAKVKCIFAGSNVRITESDCPNHDYSGKNILFVGVNWERKGGPVLIRAFQEVLKKIPDAHLYIVGCSPEVDVPNCRVLGKVSMEEVEKKYSIASVFCLPTRIEPFGIVFVEAMTRRLPVVASNIGAIPDMIRHGINGYLYHPDDWRGFAEGLTDLLLHPGKCKQFGDAGHQIASSRYTWDNTGRLLKQYITPFIH